MESVRVMFGSAIPWMVALNVIGVSIIAPVLPAYADHFGVGFTAVSTLLTAFALARMAMRLPAGSLADSKGSQLICTSGGAVQAVGAIIAAFAPGFGVLLVARGMQGVGSALFGTAVNRYLLVVTDKADLGRAMSGFQGGIYLGATLGPFLGGVLAEQFGIFAPFYAQAAIATLLAIVSRSFIRDTGMRDTGQQAEQTTAKRHPISMLLAIPGFKVVMALGFALFFVRAGAINVLVPAFGDEILGMSPSQIGAIISLGSIVAVAMMPVAGMLADTMGRLPVALAGAIATAVTVSAYGVFASRPGIAIVSAVLGIGLGLGAVALPTIIGDLAPPGTEGRASGVYRMANDMAWVTAPAALGLMADGGDYSLAFIAAGLPSLIGAMILWRWMRTNQISPGSS